MIERCRRFLRRGGDPSGASPGNEFPGSIGKSRLKPNAGKLSVVLVPGTPFETAPKNGASSG
jgi:hypothetical protein